LLRRTAFLPFRILRLVPTGAPSSWVCLLPDVDLLQSAPACGHSVDKRGSGRSERSRGPATWPQAPCATDSTDLAARSIEATELTSWGPGSSHGCPLHRFCEAACAPGGCQFRRRRGWLPLQDGTALVLRRGWLPSALRRCTAPPEGDPVRRLASTRRMVHTSRRRSGRRSWCTGAHQTSRRRPEHGVHATPGSVRSRRGGVSLGLRTADCRTGRGSTGE